MFLVLQEDKCLIGALDAEELVVGHLVGADYKVHLAVVHIQPGYGTLVVIISFESIRLAEQILRHAGFDGDVGCSLQVIPYLVDVSLVGIVIPHRLQRTVGGTADQSVWAVLIRIVPGIEFFPGHVRGVETCSGKSIGIAFHEGFAGGAVPRAVVYFREGFLNRVGNAVQEGLFVAKVLFPIDGIHFVGGKTVKVKHFLAIVRDAAQVGSPFLFSSPFHR